VTIKALLFDADGVIQRPSALRHESWQALFGHERDAQPFLDAVFECERRALEGTSDFIGALSGLLREWQCQGTLKDALAVWTMIAPDPGMTQLVQTLRQGGIRCYLATNQEPHRAFYMSDQLGYRRLFDGAFYSCRMGVAKPATAYFRAIIDELGLPAANVLFIDDNEANVNSARDAGLNALQFLVDSGPSHLKHALRGFGVHVV
jgi:putative hydrolase of the HAD superfamily